MVFEIDKYDLTFGKREFYLVTGFLFGENIATLDYRHGFPLCMLTRVTVTD